MDNFLPDGLTPLIQQHLKDVQVKVDILLSKHPHRTWAETFELVLTYTFDEFQEQLVTEHNIVIDDDNLWIGIRGIIDEH